MNQALVINQISNQNITDQFNCFSFPQHKFFNKINRFFNRSLEIVSVIDFNYLIILKSIALQ